MADSNKKHKAIAAAIAAALVFGTTPVVAFGGQAQGDATLTASHLSTQAKLTSGKASKASKNAKARKAYKKKLASIKKENGFGPSYKFIDLTNDGIDELVVAWWPTIYTYKSGKVKKVESRSIGSSSYAKAYKKKKVITYHIPDHMGSNSVCYAKWNGKKFKTVASVYEPTSKYAKSEGIQPVYTVKGKKVSKATANKYIKKLVGKAKATNIGWKSYKKFK